MENKYLAWDGINGDHQFCDTIEGAREACIKFFSDDGMYSEDMDSCMILKIVEKVGHKVIDKKSNYKYESEDAAIEATDVEALIKEDYWPYDVDCDEQWEHKFIKSNE